MCSSDLVMAWQNGEYAQDSIDAKIAEWDNRLARVFNRGFWDGYYQGQKLGEWTRHYGSLATRKKVYAGQCTNFFKNISVAEFLLEAIPVLNEGDELLVTGETTGVYETIAQDMHNDDQQVTSQVKQGELFALKTTKTLHRGDKLFKMVVQDND